MCLLAKRESCDLVSEWAKVKRQTEQANHNGYVFSRNHITNAGLQLGTTLCFLSPKCIIDVSTGKMVDPDTCSYVWLPNINISGLPKEELCRSICTSAPNLQPLRNLFDVADDILGSNIGPALLAWDSFYGLHQYQWLSANTRHFNIPILYGEPMVGKTLIAMCATWLTGCKETHIAFRYFSRVLVIKVEPQTKEKRPGDAKVLEDHCKLASAAFPIVLNALSTITMEQVHQETVTMQTKIPAADQRILEGIAYPLCVAKVNKCGKCNRIGRPVALWIQCCGCERWFHRARSGLTYSKFKQMTEEAVWKVNIVDLKLMTPH